MKLSTISNSGAQCAPIRLAVGDNNPARLSPNPRFHETIARPLLLPESAAAARRNGTAPPRRDSAAPHPHIAAPLRHSCPATPGRGHSPTRHRHPSIGIDLLQLQEQGFGRGTIARQHFRTRQPLQQRGIVGAQRPGHGAFIQFHRIGEAAHLDAFFRQRSAWHRQNRPWPPGVASPERRGRGRPHSPHCRRSAGLGRWTTCRAGSPG